MATDVPTKTQTPPPTESKSARKKKGKAEAAALAAAEPARSSSQAPSETARGDANGSGGSYDNPYIREIQKQIRNINKKLNSMQKLDQILAENPTLSLDELVSARKINADQKAQAQKKPALQQQLNQLEEQLITYKKIDEDYQAAHAKEKELLQSSHAEELEKLRATVIKEHEALKAKDFKLRLLTLSRFLAAAARRRYQGDDATETEESQAFEGALSLLYAATPEAVYAMEKLIDGSEDHVPVQDQSRLTGVTYARVRELVFEECGSEDPFSVETEVPVPAREAPPADTTASASDPTITNAGLTEIDTAVSIPNGSADTEALDTPAAPASTTIGEGAGNAAAEEQWDAKPGADDPLAESYEIVPRDPAETETPHDRPIAAPATQSWADDHPADSVSWTPVESTSAGAPQPTPPTAANGSSDGFHEVHHHRGRGPRGDGRGRGGYRGDGFRGGRARAGPRGDFRSRGRGGSRGERVGFRGGRTGSSSGEAAAQS